MSAFRACGLARCALILLVTVAAPLAQAAIVGHWQLNETTGTTAVDISGNANNGTLTSGPTWTIGKVGGGLNFDGVDDIVNAGSGTTLDDLVAQGSGGMTVAAWIYANNMGESGDGRIVAKGTTPAGGWHFKLGGTNQVEFVVDYTTTDLKRRSAVNTISTGAWRHVAATWNGSATATNVTIYVDGMEVGSYDLTTNGVGARASDASANLYIGNESGGTRTFNGVIDDVRVYNSVLTADDIQSLYQSGGAGLMAYWQLHERSGTSAADVSGNANNGTLSGGATWTAGEVGGGLSFDGVDDIVNAGSGGTLDNLVAHGGGGMTVAAWIYANNMGESGDGRIVAKGLGTSGGWHFKLGGTNQVEFVMDYATTDLTRRSAVNTISTGAWRHVAATWNGSATATNVKIYVDGVEVSSYDITTNGVGARADDSAASLYIGNESGGTRTFSGVLDEVRVYNRVLSPGEIQALVNPAYIQGIANRVSWWRLGETSGTTAVDQNAVQNGVYTGGYTLNQPALPVATSNPSISLNGSTGYVSVADNAAYSLATGTIAIWFKPTSLAADFGIFSKNAPGATNGDIYAWYKSSDNTLRIGFQSTAGDTSLVLPGKLQANVKHCLVIRWGNGVPFDAWISRGPTLENLGAHASAAGTLVGNTTPWSFGRTADIGATFYLPGTLDDVMLWSRRLTNMEVRTVALSEIAALETKLNAEYDSGWITGITNDAVNMYDRYPGIDGLVDMYKATGKTIYIRRAIDMSLAYIAKGADLNPADGYLEWWSSANSTWNHHHYEARAALGMSFMVAAVFTDPALASFVTKATPVRDYLTNDFWPKWTGGFGTQANTTTVTHFVGRYGGVALNLHRATGSSTYSTYVGNRAAELKYSLQLEADGAYNWETYLVTPPALPTSNTVDTHHAGDTTNFMVETYLSGGFGVFNSTDMANLVSTVELNLWDGSLTAPHFANMVNGTGGFDGSEGWSQGAWAKLDRFDPGLRSLHYTWQNVGAMSPNRWIRCHIYGALARAFAEGVDTP